LRVLAGIAIATALALASPAMVIGQESVPLVTDRPTFSAGAVTVSPGRFQFETGYTFSESGEEREQSFGELLARVGILSWLEGRLGLNSFVLLQTPTEDQTGLQDLNLAAKAVLYRRPEDAPAAVPQVALLAGAVLPTGTSEVGEKRWQPGARMLLDFHPADRLSIGANLGWGYVTSGGESFNRVSGSLVIGYSISGSLTAFAEWFGLFPEVRDGGNNHYLDGGVTWLLSPAVQLDWRIGVGLQDPDPNWFTGAGISFRL
jgi:hypothetical protein